MEISFSEARTQKLLGNSAKLKGKYGPRMAALIAQRVADLQAADNLAVMKTLPGRCHELTENWKGHFALDLVHPDRLVFKPDHKPPPTNASGALEWDKVTKVQIVGIGDYHPKK